MIHFWTKYKYWALTTVIFTWMLIFDGNNILELTKIRRDINALNEKKEFYILEIENLKKEEKELFSNNRNLEKFAREKYFMKKNNEDIFIIREED